MQGCISMRQGRLASGASSLRRNAGLSTAPMRCRSRRAAWTQASKQTDIINTAISTGTKLVDQAAGLVPESVPRSVAKGGVALLGTLFVFGLIQKVISGFVTLLVFLGIGYWYVTRNDDDGDSNEKPPGSSSDMDDPLSDAKKIMDKYK